MFQRTPQFDAAFTIVKELRAAGHEAYFAAARSARLLLGRVPKD